MMRGEGRGGGDERGEGEVMRGEGWGEVMRGVG